MPVRDGGALLSDCLESLKEEIQHTSLLVVDDASNDDSVSIAKHHGARVISHATSLGPYAARNTGWRASTADIIVFTDVRCRPDPGWLDALLSALHSDGIAIVGCDIETRVFSPTTAQRWAIAHQPLRVRGYLEHPYLPYVPTACLAIRREHLVALDGFSAVRSGADADLCWRAQLADLGTVTEAAVGMAAIPRDTSLAVVKQFRRYGRSGRELQRQYAADGHPPRPPRVLGTAHRILKALWAGRADAQVALLDGWRIAAYERAFRREARRDSRPNAIR